MRRGKMVEIKIVLRKKQNKDGSCPLAFRITKERKSSYIYLGKNVKESDWDAKAQCVLKTHPNSKRLNNFLLQKRAEANDKMLEVETFKESSSSKIIKQNINLANGGDGFFAYADAYHQNFKLAGKYNRYYPDGSRIKKFKEYLHKPVKLTT